MKIRPMGAQLFHADGHRDRWTDRYKVKCKGKGKGHPRTDHEEPEGE